VHDFADVDRPADAAEYDIEYSSPYNASDAAFDDEPLDVCILPVMPILHQPLLYGVHNANHVYSSIF
jgi:hypothetical protein